MRVLGQYLVNQGHFVHRLLFFKFSLSAFRRYGICLQLELLMPLFQRTAMSIKAAAFPDS